MKNAKLALTREAILNKVWGFEYDGNDRTIDTHVKMLRHSLGEYGERIRTIRGMGYSFDGEVVEK
jgi:DNA-binding response OmpR family regulator